MPIELRKTKGTGRNARYDVLEDGKIVGEIHRHGDSSVWIRGHYGELLASCNSFEDAKTKALTVNFPDADEIYERVCARIEANRRLSLERSCGPELARLSRELLNNSVKAMEELGILLNAIDDLVRDIERSTRRPQNARSPSWHTEYLLGKAVRWDPDLECVYPEPPESLLAHMLTSEPAHLPNR